MERMTQRLAPIDELLNGRAPATKPAATRTYILFELEAGVIRLELLEELAPRTCAAVAQLVESGIYNDRAFYRGEPTMGLQGGYEVPGQPQPALRPKIPYEWAPDMQNVRGFVNLPRWDDPDSGQGEFFLLTRDAPHLGTEKG